MIAGKDALNGSLEKPEVVFCRRRALYERRVRSDIVIAVYSSYFLDDVFLYGYVFG